MVSRIFFPLRSVEEWSEQGKIEVTGAELVLLPASRRYDLEEAAHVLREVVSGECPHGLLGKVLGKAQLEQLGAELFDTSMVLGDNAYEVEPGWLALPSCSLAEHASARAVPRGAGAPLESEAALLAQHLTTQ